MCFVMNKIAITRHPHSAQHFLLPTSLPSAEKSSVLPPITGCEERSEIKLGRQFPQQLTGQTQESSFRSRLCRAEVSERCPYDWRLVNVFGHVATAYYEDLKTRDRPAFRACVPLFPIPHSNNNKKVVLCGHNTYIFAVITSGAPFGGAPMADGSIHNQYSDARLRLSALDDPQQEHLRRRLRRCPAQSVLSTSSFILLTIFVHIFKSPTILSPSLLCHLLPSPLSPSLTLPSLPSCKGDNVCKILMKNMTWTDNQAGKACVKTTVQRTRNNTDQPLVLPKVMTHVMYSIGINATAGVILNATRQRWTSDTHSDYYMDGDGTVPTVSLSSILQDAVPIARILDIIAQATAEEMEYDDSLNPPDFLAVYVLSPHLYPTAFTILVIRILILRHEADPFSSSVSSSIYSWIIPPTKAKAKVAAANQAKLKTSTAPKTK
ncbi:hypothetical protein BLNAU_21353 [Blattamonas nauphoetae]|uniref:Uncharacterized protein n=1 Tax=Blattamonas nauphoetae TaxID=2049346 RepID=A0ABQ9WW29_9EUKA|nr:hypothetical protein BLNAU_21353 [Blattamonas nauphoetae]